MHIVAAVEMFKDLSRLTSNELIDSLEAHEMRMKKIIHTKCWTNISINVDISRSINQEADQEDEKVSIKERLVLTTVDVEEISWPKEEVENKFLAKEFQN